MRSVHLSALTALALGALVPSAYAAQTFTFANPYANGTGNYASNYQFQTGGFSPTTPPTISTIESRYTGPVNLIVIGGATAGTYTATYSLKDSANNAIIQGSGGPGNTSATSLGGKLVFTSTAASAAGPAGTALLTYTYGPGAIFGTNGFGASAIQGVGVSGPLVDLAPGQFLDPTKSKFSFSFPGFFNDPTGADMLRYTAGFTSSVQAVPEPASMGVLAIGAVAMLRRRRRA